MTETFNVTMTGAQEVPSNASQASGTCQVVVSTTSAITMTGTFGALEGSVTDATLNGPATSGSTAPVVLSSHVLGTISGSTSGTFNIGPINVDATTVNIVRSAQAYCQIADAVFPNGEIRGPLLNPAVPATPGAAVGALFAALAAAGLSLARKERRR